MSAERQAGRPDPEPMQTDEVRVVVVGTVLWALAGLVLLPFWGALEDDGHLWWLGTCLAGFLMGVYGIVHVRRRRAVLERDTARRAAEQREAPREPLT